MRPGFDFERRMLDMDWHLVEAFNMNDIDTALLQEMVPTLTYALVTETACTSPRLSCKLIRILQLVVETFIECRKGDAYDAHVLQEDLIAVSNERDSFRLRLKEAKTDVKALKAQLARCTTLLKSCSQVLHAQGCSPHTIAAVESMLATSDSMMSTFTPTTDATMPKVAHLCAFCGKAFGTQDYLLKHIDRRHASTSEGVVGKGTWPIQGGGSGNNQTPNIDILTKLELLLAQHEVHMKKATADSADTLQALQNELAIERAVANELKLARSDLQWRVDETQRQLTICRAEKDDAGKQVKTMQDQVSQLQLQCHQLALTIPTTTSNNPRDSTTQGTIQRLEGALEHAKEALATARHDMKAQHDKYTELLVAHERIKNGRIAANNLHTNIVYNDASTQTKAEDLPPPPLTHSMACQAELIIAALEQSPKVADIVQCTTSQKPVLVDASTQSDPATELPPPDDDVVEVTEVVQTTGDVVMTKEAPSPNPVPICIENPMDNSTQPATSHTGVAAPIAATTVATTIADEQRAMDDESPTAILPPELTAAYIQDIMDMIELRADKACIQQPPTTTEASSRHPLPRRPFLSSGWPHTDPSVNSSIMSHLKQLTDTASRFGIPTHLTYLTQSQHDAALSAYKHHLHGLPVALLERIVAIDLQVHAMVETEWMPSEKHRNAMLSTLQARMDRREGLQNEWMARVLERKRATIATPDEQEIVGPRYGSHVCIDVPPPIAKELQPAEDTMASTLDINQIVPDHAQLGYKMDASLGKAEGANDDEDDAAAAAAPEDPTSTSRSRVVMAPTSLLDPTSNGSQNITSTPRNPRQDGNDIPMMKCHTTEVSTAPILISSSGSMPYGELDKQLQNARMEDEMGEAKEGDGIIERVRHESTTNEPTTTTNIQVKQQHLELGPNSGTDTAIAHEMLDEGGIEAITQFGGGEGEMQGGNATSSESINCNDDVLLRVLEVSTNTSAVKDTGEERASGEDVGGQVVPTSSTPPTAVQSSIEVDVDQPPFNISVRSSEQPNALDPSTLDTPHRPVDDVDKPPNDAAGSDDIAAFDDESDVSLSAGEEGTHDGKTSPLRSSPGTANVVGRGLKKMPAMMMSPTFSSAMTFHATTSSSRCRDRYEDEADGGGGSHDEFGCNDDASPGQSVRTFPSSASSSSPAAATVAIRPNSTAYSIAKRDFDDDDLDEEFIT